MLYTSTRNNEIRVEASAAIATGISQEGGLFVPCALPALTAEEITAMAQMGYIEKAKFVLSKFLTDFSEQELDECVNGAYGGDKFDDESIAPLSKLDEHTYMLELWHGPTCAFKDMALQLLPHLLQVSAKKNLNGKEVVILVATSGDTGKAALEGFRDVEATKIMVFYPSDGVSSMQKLQMATQEGANVEVCAIHGNFDDAQSGVKKIFTDPQIKELLARNNMVFSSANSINWGRLVPQIVYYFAAYSELLADGEIIAGEEINIVVPTGNFGNILAAYYAKCMGLPVKKLICASNVNNVLTDFITTGEYDRNRPFFATASPSMDILISSNLERLLYHLSGEDIVLVNDLMSKLQSEGKYCVPDALKEKIQSLFDAGCCNDEETRAIIGSLFASHSYLCDTHTAVAVKVYRDYCERTGDQTKTVIASTANPYKFPENVLASIEAVDTGSDEFAMADRLQAVTGAQMPLQLAGLKDKPVRFKRIVGKDEMYCAVKEMLNLKD